MLETRSVPGVRIGKIAAEFGLNPKTIRYYEEIGLLPPAQRTAAGYRLYTDRDRDRLRFIAKAKAVGLTLEEIREVLVLRGDGRQPCEHVLSLLDQKLATVDKQLRALLEFKQELLILREAAIEHRGTEAAFCGIIEHYTAAR
jgi:DNA-binding transcriptional MerR regulator